MIYTASQFKNETDVLEIRLETIGDLVDKVVLAEATVDQRGRPKDLVFPQVRERFSKWENKIEYVVVDDMPEGNTHQDDMKRERWQRDALIRGMPDLKYGDTVYVSDLDEIPYPDIFEKTVALVRDRGVNGIRFGMDLHVYALNWRWLERGCRIGTLGAVLPGHKVMAKGVCGAVLWDSSVQGRPGVSGWHLTYQGGPEMIYDKITGMMDKVGALAYQKNEEDIVNLDWIKHCIASGQDVFNRPFRPSEWVGLDQLPPCVQANPEKYAHLMVERPANQDEIESVPRCTCGGVYDDQGNLGHYIHCDMAGNHPDQRSRPRALDVGGQG